MRGGQDNVRRNHRAGADPAARSNDRDDRLRDGTVRR